MTSRRPLFGLVVGAIAIGFAPVFVRWADVGRSVVGGVGPTSSAFFRLAIAVPFLFWLARGSKGAVASGAGWKIVLPGICFALDLGVWHVSIHYTTLANATLLPNMAPVFVTLGGWLIWRRRFRPLFLVGMVGALVGAALLVGASFQLDARQVKGDALGLLTAVFYGGYILSVGYLRETAGIGAARVVAWAALVAALLLLPVALVSDAPFWPTSRQAWGALIALALVAQVLGQGLIAYALAHLPAAFSSVTLLIQPACATLLGWLWFSETLSPLQGLGALVIAAGILTARRGSQSPARGSSAGGGPGG